MNERRLVNTYSSGLSSVMMFCAREPLISSSKAASVVDLPQPVGPDTITSPVGAATSRRNSGSRLHARRSPTDGDKRRTAIANPRMVLYTLILQRVPPTTTETSADPRASKSVQSSDVRNSLPISMSWESETDSPRGASSPLTRATGAVPASRCRSLAPSLRALRMDSLKVNSHLGLGRQLGQCWKQVTSRLFVVFHFELEAVLERGSAGRRGTRTDLVNEPLEIRARRPGGIAENKGQRPAPAPDRHVDDRVGITDHETLLAQAGLENSPMPLRLVVVALLRILLRLRSDPVEMHRLSRIRTDPAGDKHQPRKQLGTRRRRIGRKKFTRFLCEIKKNGVAVEHLHVTVLDRGRFAVRIDRAKGGSELLAPAGVDGDDLVRQTRLLQHQGHLGRVGGGVEIESDHSANPLW